MGLSIRECRHVCSKVAVVPRDVVIVTTEGVINGTVTAIVRRVVEVSSPAIEVMEHVTSRHHTDRGEITSTP